jgi:hypothetical protein
VVQLTDPFLEESSVDKEPLWQAVLDRSICRCALVDLKGVTIEAPLWYIKAYASPSRGNGTLYHVVLTAGP